MLSGTTEDPKYYTQTVKVFDERTGICKESLERLLPILHSVTFRQSSILCFHSSCLSFGEGQTPTLLFSFLSSEDSYLPLSLPQVEAPCPTEDRVFGTSPPYLPTRESPLHQESAPWPSRP